MDTLLKAVEAADGPWPVLAIFIIGLYVLVWRYGGALLAIVRANTEVAAQANAKADQISAAIVTNHGSANLGEAVDRLYEELTGLRGEFTAHLAQAVQLLAAQQSQAAALDQRLRKLEEAA